MGGADHKAVEPTVKPHSPHRKKPEALWASGQIHQLRRWRRQSFGA
jgi:hypothetical protein